ncbi:F-box domain-containing protein [Mycena venus]|uniref:F-box domain-containing protein n=1 Tax=Mycena venus TaxID=2733690 RepID=A0A8H7CZA8_9AGAR|nr:F-box domain-containing protein [Mycena venus]
MDQQIQEQEENLENHWAISSPVRRVPAEILCEIFFLTLPWTRRVGNLDVEQAPWRLGLVCRQWRTTALVLPRLWSSITLYSSLAKAVHPPTMVETHLYRSANTPLTVTLNCEDGEFKAFNFSACFNLVFLHSMRWETVRLHLRQSFGGPFFTHLRTVNGQLPMLRTLEITESMSSPFDIDNPSLMGDMFSIAPRLREVLISTAGEYRRAWLPLPNIQLPWAQLTRLRGAYRSHEEVLWALRSCPQLVECGITLLGQHFTTLDDSRHLTLPNLRHLSVNNPDFLTFITAPSLQELWISGDAIYHLDNLIQRSSCTLVKLVIDRCSQPSDLIDILRAIPTLTTLFVFISDKAIARGLFDALKIRGDLTDICLNLTHVAAGGSEGFGINTFVDMVETRWYGDGLLTRLSFMRTFYTQKVRCGPKARIHKMQSEGLDARFDTAFHPSPQNYFGAGCP